MTGVHGFQRKVIGRPRTVALLPDGNACATGLATGVGETHACKGITA
jgi:hypothetical protein